MEGASSFGILIVEADFVRLFIVSELFLLLYSHVLWSSLIGLIQLVCWRSRRIRFSQINFYRDGRVIAAYSFSELTDSSYSFALTLPPPFTELAIEQNLRQSGIFVKRVIEFIQREQNDHEVEATPRNPNNMLEQRRFVWLIGTGGDSSTVPNKSGISFDGEVVPVVFALVDAYASGLSAYEGAYYFGERGSLDVAPISPDLFRFATSAFAGDDVDSVTEEIQKLLDNMGVSGCINRIRYAAQFQASVKQASTYRSGRVLLAGDAAHLSTPASGQGINTGFQDAVALERRLAHVLLGHLDQSVLDEYDKERRSHVGAVLAWTRAQTSQIDERASSSSAVIPSPRQMAQLDICYGEEGIRIPPLPESVLRYRKGYDPVAPTVLLFLGTVYAAKQWRNEAARMHSVAPAYFQIVDFVDTVLAPHFTNIFGQEREAFVV